MASSLDLDIVSRLSRKPQPRTASSVLRSRMSVRLAFDEHDSDVFSLKKDGNIKTYMHVNVY